MNMLEDVAWRNVGEGWKPLYGSMRALGLSVEWHEFHCAQDLDWGRSFHPDSVELCLNLAGSGEVLTGGSEPMRFAPGMLGFYIRAHQPLRAIRTGGESHRFITIECSLAWLLRLLHGRVEELVSPLREALSTTPHEGMVGAPQPMSEKHLSIAEAFRHPEVSPAARSLWYEAKVMELFSEAAFDRRQEFFCERQKRLSQERSVQAEEILRRHLADPPSLEALARMVGISASYLSRTFSQEHGETIPQFIRRLRMEEAARMLRAGTHNVSEAAFAVGYSTLGHFSQSFKQVMGESPSAWLQRLAGK